ncbi:MAG TPA: hypothetical protein VIV11_02740 [Kofleriaceae bacterium]
MQNELEPIEIQPAHIRHFLAIHSALTPIEAAQMCEVALAFSPAELYVWFSQLVDLTTPQAVQHIRVLLGGNTEAVS